jgi:hypothetical protein
MFDDIIIDNLCTKVTSISAGKIKAEFKKGCDLILWVIV